MIFLFCVLLRVVINVRFEFLEESGIDSTRLDSLDSTRLITHIE